MDNKEKNIRQYNEWLKGWKEFKNSIELAQKQLKDELEKKYNIKL